MTIKQKLWDALPPGTFSANEIDFMADALDCKKKLDTAKVICVLLRAQKRLIVELEICAFKEEPDIEEEIKAIDFAIRAVREW